MESSPRVGSDFVPTLSTAAITPGRLEPEGVSESGFRGLSKPDGLGLP